MSLRRAARHRGRPAAPASRAAAAPVVVRADDLGRVHLPEARDQRRLLAQVARALRAGDDEGAAAVGEEAAVEEPQRLVHEARRLVVLERHRLLHLRVGIAQRVPPPGDGDVPVVGAGDAVLVHLPAREVAHEGDRADVAVRDGPRRAEELRDDALRAVLRPEGAQHDLAEAGLDRHDRGLHHADGGRAAHVHRRAEGRRDAEERRHARRPAVLLAHLRGHQAEHAVDGVARRRRSRRSRASPLRGRSPWRSTPGTLPKRERPMPAIAYRSRSLAGSRTGDAIAAAPGWRSRRPCARRSGSRSRCRNRRRARRPRRAPP